MQIPIKYLNFSDVFLKEKILVLLVATGVNQYAIKLQKSQQSPYDLIYILNLVKFQMLKTYIKTNLANCFIQLLKLFISIPIFFI